MAADGMPRAGLVSQLASKFGEKLKSSKESMNEPAVAEPAPAPSSSPSSQDPLQQAICSVVEQTKPLKAEELVNLANLLTEAKEAESLDALQLVGEKMASISKGVPAALGNYASALTETIPVFQWKHLQASGVKPGDFISGCRESAQFYLNRIRVELKNKGEQSQWVSAVEELLQKVKASSSGKDVAAPPAKSNAPQAAAKQAAKGSSEPAVTLNGNKWTVENGSNSSDPVTIRVESFGQAIFVDNCAGLTIVVEGKVNAIAINRCKKLKVQVGDVVSNIEALTSNGCDLFLQGSVPTVVLDNCEGVRMFLTERSKAVQVLSSKCSELNLVASRALLGQMGVEDAEETVEIALPFQFKSVLGEDGHIHTEPVKHAGA